MADWYVRNVAENDWWVNEKFGAESFPVPGGSQVGVRVLVLEPGKPSTLYHRESGQEGFLVIDGECLLIVEGEERPLRRWDYFHCPLGTAHSFVGAGDGPCVLMTLASAAGQSPTHATSSRSSTPPASRRRRIPWTTPTRHSRSGGKAVLLPGTSFPGPNGSRRSG